MKKSEEAWKEYQDFKDKVTGGKMWRVTIGVIQRKMSKN